MTNEPLCREKRRALGLAYPRSGCDKCGSVIQANWKCAESDALERIKSVADIPDHELLRRAVLSFTPVKTGGRPRWSAVMRRFQLGSTYANQLCERFGVDPDTMVHR